MGKMIPYSRPYCKSEPDARTGGLFFILFANEQDTARIFADY
jgi:hypothetical protein